MDADENDLLDRLISTSIQCGCSPEALINLGKAAADWNKQAVVPKDGTYPITIDEAPITPEQFEDWPGWVAQLIPPGSQWERLHWPDGSITIRLIDNHSRVLAARHFVDSGENEQ